MNQADLEKIFTYHNPTEDQIQRMATIRQMCLDLCSVILDFCPDCAERGAAIINLEQVSMHTNAGIVRREG